MVLVEPFYQEREDGDVGDGSQGLLFLFQFFSFLIMQAFTEGRFFPLYESESYGAISKQAMKEGSKHSGIGFSFSLMSRHVICYAMLCHASTPSFV